MRRHKRNYTAGRHTIHRGKVDQHKLVGRVTDGGRALLKQPATGETGSPESTDEPPQLLGIARLQVLQALAEAADVRHQYVCTFDLRDWPFA